MNALNYHTAAASNVIKFASNRHVRTHNPLPKLFASHFELVDYCYGAIVDAFTQMGAHAPSIDELVSAVSGFIYAKPLDRKDKSKIGFAMDCSWSGEIPKFTLTINSFKHGGSSVTLKSFDLLAPLFQELSLGTSTKKALSYKKPKVNKPTTKVTGGFNKVSNLTNESRLALFEQLCDKFSKADFNDRHPYIRQKAITNVRTLKTHDDDLMIPLFKLPSLDKDLIAASVFCGIKHVGFQIIKGDGSKKIYVKQQGDLSTSFMIIRGNLHEATKVYLCEGYATGDKVSYLSGKKDICVIGGISANNLTKVVVAFKKHFSRIGRPIKFEIVADNDIASELAGKGNAGLRFGFDALRLSGNDARIIIPNCRNQQSDWDDKYRDNPKGAKKSFIHQSFKRHDIVLEKLKYFPKSDKVTNTVKTAIFDAAKELLSLCPALFTFDHVLTKIHEACAHVGATHDDINRICKSVFSKIEKTALSHMSLTDKYLDEHVEVDSVDEIKTLIDEKTKEALSHDKTVVFMVDAPMGCGKTQKVLKPLFKEADEKGHFPVAAYSTRSLTLAGSSILGASHYELDKGHDFDLDAIKYRGSVAATSLVSTINSVTHDRFRRFTCSSSFFALDEASQVIRSIVSGTVDNSKRISTERFVANMINRSRKTILTDADINDDVAKYVDDIKGKDVLSIGIKLKQKAFKNVTYNFVATTDDKFNHSFLVKKLIDDIKGGENVYFAMDSRDHANAVVEALREHIDVEEDLLLVSADTIDTDRVKSFLSNPTKYIDVKRPRLVIATPSIQSGVSIEVKNHFTKGYGSYFREVLPNDFRQMLHRVRDLKHFSLSLPCPTVRVDEFNEDADYIYAAAIRAEMENYLDPLNSKYSNIELSDGAVRFKNGAEHFEKLASSVMASTCHQRNNATNNFLLQARHLGVSLQGFFDDMPEPDDKLKIKRDFKKFKDAVKTKQTLEIVGANTLSQADREALSKKVTLTREEQIEVKRFDLANLLEKDFLSEEDVILGSKFSNYKLRNYNFCADMPLAQMHDIQESINNIALTQRSNKKLLVFTYYLMVSLLGIDEVTLEGNYDEKSALKLREALLANQTVLDFVRVKLKIGLTTTYKPILLVSMLLKRMFGLSHYASERTRANDRKQQYSLDASEVDTFLKLANRQREIDNINHDEVVEAA